MWQKLPAKVKATMCRLSQASPTALLACALLEQETTVRAQIPKIAARARVLCSKMLFELVSIEDFWENYECRDHMVDKLTRLWQRPGEFLSMGVLLARSKIGRSRFQTRTV